MQYDIAVIGNDEAAFEMLRLAARSGKRTAAVLPESCHSSWMVGLALKRLVSDLLLDQSMPRRRMLERTGSPRLLRQLLAAAVGRETSDHMDILERLNVDVKMGQPRFVDRNTLCISDGRTCRRSTVAARHFVIGTGVRPTAMHRPLGLVALHRPEALFEGMVLPNSLCVVGGGSLGCGMAALFALFGVRSQHVARDDQNDALLELARAAGVEVAFHPSEFGLTHVGGVLSAKHTAVIDSRRAVGFTEHLNLAAIDVEADENGQLWCSSGFETWCPGIFGIGSVVGFSPDMALHPSVQAERIQRRITRLIPRPLLMDVCIASEQRASNPHRTAVSTINN